MATALTWSKPSGLPAQRAQDESMALYGVSWKDYVILREALDIPGLRMTYCEGVLEIMSPSRAHETDKSMAARLVELYAFLRRLPLQAYGSTTFRREATERGAEPDECWCVGAPMEEGSVPQIVLEVIHKSPILDKLDVYDGLGVAEVWLFKDRAFEVYARRPDRGGYDRAAASAFLPDLDLALVARFVGRLDQAAAVQEFADALGR
jgi:Uma2 family endonuclease